MTDALSGAQGKAGATEAEVTEAGVTETDEAGEKTEDRTRDETRSETRSGSEKESERQTADRYGDADAHADAHEDAHEDEDADAHEDEDDDEAELGDILEGGPEPSGNRWLSRLLIAGSLAAVLAAVLVAALLLRPGSDDSSPSAPSAESADAGFARDMAVHHQQAVELSFIVRDRTGNAEVRSLAYDIINTQANQRGMLLGWLEAWDLPKSSQEPPMTWMKSSGGSGGMNDMGDMKGMKGMEGMKDMKNMAGMADYKPHDGSLMPGMATNTQMDQLRRASGRNAEIMYLRLMTAHHQGGIAMSQGAAMLASTKEIRGLAAGMATSQQYEVKLMADMLKERGAKP